MLSEIAAPPPLVPSDCSIITPYPIYAVARSRVIPSLIGSSAQFAKTEEKRIEN